MLLRAAPNIHVYQNVLVHCILAYGRVSSKEEEEDEEETEQLAFFDDYRREEGIQQ